VRNIGLAVVGIVCVIFVVIVILNRRPLAPAPAVAPAGAGRSRHFDFDTYEREKKDREDPEAAGRIPGSEIRFGELRPVPGIETGTLDAVRARLYDDSARFTLTDYAYDLVVEDCLPSQAAAPPSGPHESRCTTVFERRGWASISVPARQARDVVIEIPKDPTTNAPPFVLLGTARIELTATGARAYLTP
jgi:hypothetical protein